MKPRQPSPRRGYTLIELVTVMVILALLSGGAATTLTGLAGTRRGSALAELAAGMTHAQNWARATSRTTWVEVDPANERVHFYVEDPLLPGKANRTPMTDPLAGGSYTLEFDEPGAGLLAADFAGTNELAFGFDGEPSDANGAPLVTDGSVTIEGGSEIWVSPETGLLRLVN